MDSLVSVTRSSRIALQSRDELCDEYSDKNCYEAAFEFKCVFEGCCQYGFECGCEGVYTQSETAVSW